MLPIVTYPNPILENENKEVEFPLSKGTKELIQQMWQTVKGKGIGLAAPQVGADLKICIIHMASENAKKTTKDKDKDKDKDFVMINPKIKFYSESKSLFTEGCLSFPDQFYDIWRPYGITVEYQDEKGRAKVKTCSGMLARVIQHEVDHLNGKLFINLGGKKIEPQKIDKTKLIE